MRRTGCELRRKTGWQWRPRNADEEQGVEAEHGEGEMEEDEIAESEMEDVQM
jgi:hypothetical protein